MIAGIVLAAGRSRRMGTQKLLLPWARSTVIAHIVDQLLKSRLSHLHVVLGRDADAVRAALAGRPLTFVTNPASEGDMLSSVRCGLRALPPSCHAALVALGDQPRLSAGLVNELLEAFAVSGKPIVLPRAEGRGGHPVLIARCCFEEVLAGYDDVGLRGLLRARAADVHEHPVGADAVLSDMDTPLDYQRELRRAADGRETYPGTPAIEPS